MVLIPSDAAMRAMANDVARSFAPSSIPGSKWQCRSINLPPHLSSRKAREHVHPPTAKRLDLTMRSCVDAFACTLWHHCGMARNEVGLKKALRRIPEAVFGRLVAALILALGVVMFFEARR